MEEEVLGALRFELTAPTPRVFLRRLVKAAHALGPADPRCASLQAAGCAGPRGRGLLRGPVSTAEGSVLSGPAPAAPSRSPPALRQRAHAGASVLGPSVHALALAPAGSRSCLMWAAPTALMR
jgi:hypothetical protein